MCEINCSGGCVGCAPDEHLEDLIRIVYAAWSLRNQFNGPHDDTYFPALSRELDAVFGNRSFPVSLLSKEEMWSILTGEKSVVKSLHLPPG